ncbi:MAG: arsenic efflux protein [Clostridia bacterium]|nr:arsenic efflux protein [Clostridia bacterium]
MIFLNRIFISVMHASHEGHSRISEFFKNNLGKFGEFFEEVFFHGIIDTLPLLPFLFLTYLLMEFIEHRSDGKTVRFLKRSGPYGPLLGGAVGIIPQCGFSSVASNLYTAKIISMGTIVAVFLSTSDEMLPLLISNPDIKLSKILFILLYKLTVAIAVGFAIDFVLHVTKRDKKEINIDELCDNDNCHCERGIFYSALHHTLKISVFIFICTVLINAAVYFIGDENLVKIMYDKPFISHLIAAVFGLIPNCAASVALTEFYTSGFITLGTMLSGLFSGAGVGLLVLFKINKHIKANLLIVAILIFVGTVAGLFADAICLDALI